MTQALSTSTEYYTHIEENFKYNHHQFSLMLFQPQVTYQQEVPLGFLFSVKCDRCVLF